MMEQTLIIIFIFILYVLFDGYIRTSFNAKKIDATKHENIIYFNGC